MARQNLLFSLWKGVWIIAPWVAVGGSLYLVFGYHADPPQIGNPMRPKTWQEAGRQDRAAGEERAQRRFWIEQVESGGMSFEEAGCGYSCAKRRRVATRLTAPIEDKCKCSRWA